VEGIAKPVTSLPFVDANGIVSTLTAKGNVPNRKVDLAIVGGRLALYVALLLVLLPPGKAVAFFFVQMALFGVFLGGSFAPNHKGMPIIPAGMKVDFLRRQVITSRNVPEHAGQIEFGQGEVAAG